MPAGHRRCRRAGWSRFPCTRQCAPMTNRLPHKPAAPDRRVAVNDRRHDDGGGDDDDEERSRFLLLLLLPPPPPLLLVLVKRCRPRSSSIHNGTRPDLRRGAATDIVRLQLSPAPALCPLRIRDKSHYARSSSSSQNDDDCPRRECFPSSVGRTTWPAERTTQRDAR